MKSMKPSVWTEFIPLVAKYNPVNLGQGMPDFNPPDHLTKALSQSALSSDHSLQQYTRGFGHPRLVNALSTLYSQLSKRHIDPFNEVLVTIGADEALYCSIFGFVNKGDEVVIIEPYFDNYDVMVQMAGGVPVFVPLRPKKCVDEMTSSDWILDAQEFESKFNDKTKLVIVNTPHNPTGKVFTESELAMIAAICKKYDCLVVMDEVYEWMIFDDKKHIRMNTLPDMWERTITIGSAGKTFNVTGWKIGWAYGPKQLIQALQMVHQNCVYTCATPLQEALAVGFEAEIARLDQPTSYWKELVSMLQRKRDFIVDVLKTAGMNPLVPDGGYFVLADFSNLSQRFDFSAETGDTNDVKFAKWLTKNKKLQGIPPSAFYCEEHKKIAENYIRFCFCKRDETLKEAEKILLELSK